MLSKVEARNRQGDLLTLELEDVSDGLIIQKITGLDPVKATLVSSKFATLDGEQYQSSSRETRNITVTLELDPDPAVETVRTLRKRLYKIFMPESEVKLSVFLEDGLEVDIIGVVETCETDHFSQEPVVDISMICFEPDFYDPTPVMATGLLTTDEDTESPQNNIVYDGSVETGVEIVVTVAAAMDGVTVYHTPPNDSVRTLDFITPLVVGDVLTINTVPGSKGATLLRSGISTSVLYAISPQSTWVKFVPGTNAVRVWSDAVTGSAVTIEYINKYGGL